MTRIGIIGDKCQDVSWQCPEYPTSHLNRESTGKDRRKSEGSKDARMERKQSSYPKGAEKV